MQTGADNQVPEQLPQGGVRKLVAIMFTDMKDFSKRMQQDESRTLKVLEEHDILMRGIVDAHAGTVIKTVGDAFLVSFDSVVNATECAIRVQQRLHARNLAKPTQEQILVRIGVHLGDVLIKDNDVFGDGVNIASRIQSQSEPGGVAISGSVYEQVKNKIRLRVSKLGVPQLKNIKDPVRVYQVVILPSDKTPGFIATNFIVAKSILKRKRSRRIVLGVSALLLAGLAVLRFYPRTEVAPEVNTLAILPFVNLSDSTHEYLVDGLTEDIIADVGQIAQLRVIAKASSFHFKKSTLSDEEIARNLRARYLLGASVRIAPGSIRVDARLRDATQGVEVWKRQLESPMEDLHWLKDDITREVAQHLRLKILAEHAAIKTTSQVSDLYYRGLYHARSFTKEENMYAISYFRQVLEKDPMFIPARLRLARAELINVEERWDPEERWIADARGHIVHVLEKDSLAGDAYEILGRLEIVEGRHDKGIELLTRSIELNPNAATAYGALGVEYAFNRNDAAKAVTFFLRAQELEPMEFFHPANLGIGYAMMRDYHRAALSFRRAASLNPAHENPWINLGYVYERLAQPESALIAYNVALEKNPSNPQTYENISDLLLSSDRFASADSLLTIALKFNSTSYRLLYRSGVAKQFLGNSAGAKNAWSDGLRLARKTQGEGGMTADGYVYSGLFHARLGDSSAARKDAEAAFVRDSSDNEVILGVARIFAVLGRDADMLPWFKRAKLLNPEYDAAYIATAVDFYRYRADEQLLAIARE